MHIKDFDILSDDDIDYSNLDTDTLEKLVLKANDPFIRTSSLSELKNKDQTLALHVADTIWCEGDEDKYLLAQALTTILELNSEKGMGILSEKIPNSDAYILYAIVNFLIDEYENYQTLNYFDDIKQKISSRIAKEDLAPYDDDGYLRDQWKIIIRR